MYFATTTVERNKLISWSTAYPPVRPFKLIVIHLQVEK